MQLNAKIALSSKENTKTQRQNIPGKCKYRYAKGAYSLCTLPGRQWNLTRPLKFTHYIEFQAFC